MDLTRLKYLAGQDVTPADRLQEEKMRMEHFAGLDTKQREKFLWQWCKDGQMDFKDWVKYLNVHISEETDSPYQYQDLDK